MLPKPFNIDQLYLEAEAALQRHSRPALITDIRRVIWEAQLAADVWAGKSLVFPTALVGQMRPGRAHANLQRDLKWAGLALFRVHDPRHTAATVTLDDGQQPLTVQQTLGQGNIAMTLGLFGRVKTAMLQSAVDTMDRLFDEAK